MKKVERRTEETSIVAIFGAEKTEIDTGLKFFDHMIETIAKLSGYNIVVKAKGDLQHHIIEDVAICLGKSISEIDKKGIERFGSAIVPMDEAVAICGLDFSGRGVFILNAELKDCEMGAEDFYHFFDTLCRNAGINLYLSIAGKNSHHMMEAAFKAFAIALRQALRKNSGNYRSTKGVLD